jgi:AcrR family transcriptional regulator
MENMSSFDVMTTTDGRVLRGEQTRRAILHRAGELASVEGLDNLSIGRLATDLGVSKSGVFAHFGSKEELQLATIGSARDVFVEHVVTPAFRERGLARLWAICENRLDYVQARVFPGGCFFYAVAHEYGGRPGRVRDRIAAEETAWLELLQRTIESARAAGELEPGVDAVQLAFELDAYVGATHTAVMLHDDSTAYDRARTAMRERLLRVAVRPELLEPA